MTIPFLPDSDSARELAQNELSKAMYDYAPNLFERLLRWIGERLNRLGVQLDPGRGGAGNIAVILAIVIVVVALVAFALWRSYQRAGTRVRHGRSELFNDDRSAAELVAAAHAAEAAGNLDQAVIERFRALIRLLSERNLIRVFPGMTALEAAQAASHTLGREDFFVCANIFNDVYYGHGHAVVSDVKAIRDLYNSVADRTAI